MLSAQRIDGASSRLRGWCPSRLHSLSHLLNLQCDHCAQTLEIIYLLGWKRRHCVSWPFKYYPSCFEMVCFLYGQLRNCSFLTLFLTFLIPSIPKDQWKWNPKILEIFGICHWYPFLLNFSTFWPARMTIELFKGDVSGGEAGTSFPRMVLLFLSGTIITSNGHILDRHFRKKKKIKKAIANFDSTQLESCTS